MVRTSQSARRSRSPLVPRSHDILSEVAEPQQNTTLMTEETRASHSQTRSDETLRMWLIRLITGMTLLILVLVIGLVVGTTLGWFDRDSAEGPTIRPIPIRYDADRAMGYLVQLCELGPRPSGSAAMVKQQELVTNFFRAAGAQVTMQTFEIRHPVDGTDVPMANLIARWNPEGKERFLICAHYDTRPFPDRDPTNRQGVFIGANDGASGTAGLMELANQLHDLPKEIGVDLVLFDGEEFVFEQSRDAYFLGSTFFSKKYAAEAPDVPYKAGILLDMIGDKELTLYYEGNSLKYARGLARDVWRVADDLGVRAFTPRSRHTLEDDHLSLNEIAKIPTIDIIDFDYPRPGFGAPSYWHTEKDVPENCSGKSIAAVVWVVHEWLLQQ